MTAAPGEGEEDTRQHELVIIRRRHGGEDAPHKGGVWKIAHADFMTALMAFFLVMWLINATDDKTISGVANYFNPMRLTDQSAKPKGIFTIEPGGEHDGSEKNPKSTDKHSAARPGKGGDKAAEDAMFSDPYEVLDKLAAKAGKEVPELAITERGTPPAHHAGEAFRDPFDPDSRYEAMHSGEAGGHAPQSQKDGAEAAGDKSEGGEAVAKSEPPGAAAESARVAGDKQALTELRRPIEEAVRQSGFAAIPGVEVRATPEGLLISITDQPDFEMFGLASARPKPELVVLMDKIGKIVATRPEHVVVRGHTDSRPYRSGGYDNWRLSTARAQMAYYMLMRSGIPDERIDRIEGRADHDPKITSDPLAAENRRIDILLLRSKS